MTTDQLIDGIVVGIVVGGPALLALWTLCTPPKKDKPIIIRGWPNATEEQYKMWCGATGRKYHPQGKYTTFQAAQRIVNATITRFETNRRKRARK